MHCVVFGGLLGGVFGCFGLILFVFTCINYALVAVCVGVIWFMLVVVVWCFNCVARCWFCWRLRRLVVWFGCVFDFIVVIVGLVACCFGV